MSMYIENQLLFKNQFDRDRIWNLLTNYYASNDIYQVINYKNHKISIQNVFNHKIEIINNPMNFHKNQFIVKRDSYNTYNLKHPFESINEAANQKEPKIINFNNIEPMPNDLSNQNENNWLDQHWNCHGTAWLKNNTYKDYEPDIDDPDDYPYFINYVASNGSSRAAIAKLNQQYPDLQMIHYINYEDDTESEETYKNGKSIKYISRNPYENY